MNRTDSGRVRLTQDPYFPDEIGEGRTKGLHTWRLDLNVLLECSGI